MVTLFCVGRPFISVQSEDKPRGPRSVPRNHASMRVHRRIESLTQTDSQDMFLGTRYLVLPSQ